ncbi:hypothetical protein [Paraburkholderia sp. ZP32-5]|uniref:hypothetical protein n=1 Tax=Paraburkholderia sp. ZP32-5 TaxID=2883245 RepID=UPI001F1E7AE5|nr:hypothetical protein [Paraburkholderia sp. ZP32-5]
MKPNLCGATGTRVVQNWLLAVMRLIAVVAAASRELLFERLQIEKSNRQMPIKKRRRVRIEIRH